MTNFRRSEALIWLSRLGADDLSPPLSPLLSPHNLSLSLRQLCHQLCTAHSKRKSWKRKCENWFIRYLVSQYAQIFHIPQSVLAYKPDALYQSKCIDKIPIPDKLILNKANYFRLRLSDELGTERPQRDLRDTWDWPETDLRQTYERKMKIQCFRQTCVRRTDRVTPWAPDGAKKVLLYRGAHLTFTCW